MASGRRRVAREDGAARAETRRERRGDGVGAGRHRRGREAARARWASRDRPGRGGASHASRARRSRRRSRQPSPKLTGTPSPRSGESGRGRHAAEAATARANGGRGAARPQRYDTKNKTTTQVLDIHGRQKQQKRTSTFFEFCRATSGVLLCTDVAARGLDIPEVNWIVQFDPPDDPREYVHRVGRTARGETGTGRALLFLAPAELGFLRWLRDARVALHEYEFDMSKVTNIQSALTKLVEKNYYLHRAARDAYRSYLLAYASHAHKDIFDVHSLDLQAVSESFGFAVPPRVDLNLSHRGDKKTRRNPKKGDRRKGQSGHAFSAANPYGTKSAGDARQFSY